MLNIFASQVRASAHVLREATLTLLVLAVMLRILVEIMVNMAAAVRNIAARLPIFAAMLSDLVF
jgi:hypothetical protein